MTLLAVNDVTVRYGRLTALRGITLMIAEGEVLFVTGPNGAGKSTLLNAIAGVVPAISGSIAIDGAEVTGAPPEQIALRGFSLVPEGRNVFGTLTIEENLNVGAGMRADKQQVARDLESVYHEFPMLAERRHAASRHAFRRPTADARDRPGPDGRAPAHGYRRAVARTCPRKSSIKCTRSWCGCVRSAS